MLSSLLADVAVLLHFTFIVCVIFGGLFVMRWPKISWVHLPMVLWAAVVNLMHWQCPLTPIENYFRVEAGQAGYEGGFIAHYLLPFIYPQGVSYDVGVVVGVGVFIWNAVIYSLIIYRARCGR